jgi:hypothetical protein
MLLRSFVDCQRREGQYCIENIEFIKKEIL